jgi:Cdc6-like AAA superfamily ATPase
LLCQGIPGAGKTILTSIIVQHLHGRIGQEDDIGIAYYYFNFRQQHEQTFESFYSSLLKQLSQRQHPLPECITEAYERSSAQHGYPFPGQLLNILETVITRYRKIFIVVDGLDEIMPPNDTCRSILTTLFTLQKVFPISLLATSRSLSYIATRFEQAGSNILEIRALDDDVRDYIDGRLDNLRYFASDDPDLRYNIKETILQAVDGM